MDYPFKVSLKYKLIYLKACFCLMFKNELIFFYFKTFIIYQRNWTRDKCLVYTFILGIVMIYYVILQILESHTDPCSLNSHGSVWQQAIKKYIYGCKVKRLEHIHLQNIHIKNIRMQKGQKSQKYILWQHSMSVWKYWDQVTSIVSKTYSCHIVCSSWTFW